MYYEEKVINGYLCFRNEPNGTWYQMEYEKMGDKWVEQNNKVKELRGEITRLEKIIEGAGLAADEV